MVHFSSNFTSVSFLHGVETSSRGPGTPRIPNSGNRIEAPPKVSDLRAAQHFPSPVSDNDESEIEFEKRFARAKQNTATTVPVAVGKGDRARSYKLPRPQQERNSGSSFGFDSDEDVLDVAKITRSLALKSGTANGGSVPTRRESSHSLNISTQNSTGVRTEDVLFTSIIFISHLLSFLIDFGLMCWYYWDEGASYNFKWCSALTFFILVVGSIGILHQFNQAE